VFWLLQPLKAGGDVTIDRAAAWTANVGSGGAAKAKSHEGQAAAAACALLRRAVLLGLGCPESGDVSSEEAFFVDMHLATEAPKSRSTTAVEGGVAEELDGQTGEFGSNYPLATNSTPLRASPNPAIAAATLGTLNASNEAHSDSAYSANSGNRSVVKVCSDSAWVREQLTGQGQQNLPLNPRLELTDTPDEAQALWMSMHIAQLPQVYGFKPKPAKSTVSEEPPPVLPPGCGFGYGSCQVLNQLPYEACLIRKDHLADTIGLWHAKQGGFSSSLPPWLPRTYDLTRPHEVACWLGHAIANARLRDDTNSSSSSSGSSNSAVVGLDDTSGPANVSSTPSDVWVVKPAALARSLGTTVTRSPACVMQLLLLGPQVAQAYLTPPLLYQNRKFDCRFNVLLRIDAVTRKPTLFAWSDFWVRVADRPYDIKLERLDDVTTHLTAMHLLLKPQHASPGQDTDQSPGDNKSGNNSSSNGDGVGMPRQSVPNPTCAEFEVFAAENCPDGASGWQEVKRQIHALMATSFLAAFDRCPAMLGTGDTASTSSSDSSEGNSISNENGTSNDGSKSDYPRGAAAIYGFDIIFDTSWQPHLLEVQFDPACKEGFSAAEALGCLLLGEDDGPHLVPLAFG